ncbi:acyl-CoA thioesterase II [Mycobacterium sp. SMC-4]|uniref:acyl-CoA thioesterase n=1 Tax=Mycobacterium sp. SMC-4 TaxID=2857059 RepID=UPI0021B29DB2|nr:acyl-CoA thioesterase domain-containing protein [Mycobacterium sp. SMC-4]UXA17600.1 thioesterase family protein [Mycobacterium sp. SMC-4]
MSSSLRDVLATLTLQRAGDSLFVGEQLPAPFNHILGGHISAQALLAAGLTAPDRRAHSMHTYFLRPGDARRPVDFDVVVLQEGRTFSARRVTARQDGEVLLEAMASFKHETADETLYQPQMPKVSAPESLPTSASHSAEDVEEGRGRWASLRWFERRIVCTDAGPPANSQIWWRPDGDIPNDPALHTSLVAYLSAVTLTEPAFAARGALGASAQRDHSVWFHRPAQLSDWMLYDQSSPSSVDRVALASGRMYNRNGELVCTVGQEMYFP